MRALKVPAIALLLALAACGESELYTNLTEPQANEMIAVLQNSGIDASKQALKDGHWSISGPSNKFAQAIDILRTQGLPRDQFDDLGNLFKKQGFVSSPLEERARLVFGLSQELAHSVSEIDGVVEARVHLSLPTPDPLNETKTPASASVFVKYRPGANLVRDTGQIKALVVNAIEGLAYDRVTVVLFPAAPLPGPREPDLVARLSEYSGVLMVLGLGGVGLAASWFVTRRRAGGRRAVVLRS